MSQTDPLQAFDEAVRAIPVSIIVKGESGQAMNLPNNKVDEKYLSALRQAAVKYADARVEAELAALVELNADEVKAFALDTLYTLRKQQEPNNSPQGPSKGENE